ncbi:MAG TPA: hypothetical protein VFT55_10990 [Planctomycetota bacterium]|nr:hypothetical protein [Planctomycetota bacterium]
MRAAVVLFVLLAIAAAAGWWLVTSDSEILPAGAEALPRADRPASVPATPERSQVTPDERPAEPPPDQPEGRPTATPSPPALPAADRSQVELTVRDLQSLAAVPAFRWRFRGDGPEQRGEGAEGRATLDLPPAGRGELLVEASGYSPSVRPQFAVNPNGITTVDVLLTPTVPAAGITLYVHDTALKPIANVRVDAFVLTPESREQAWHHGKALWARRTAAPDGRYTLPPLPAGEYGIRVAATDADGNLEPLLPYSRTFVLTGDNGYVEDVTLEPGCLPVFDLVDAAGAYLDPAQLGAAVALQLRLPGGPDIQRMWVVTGAGFRSLSPSAMAIGALPGVGPVRPAEALPAGTYTLEVTVAGNRRLQQSVVLRAGERQQERFVVP